MKILISGAGGYLGGRLVELLTAQHHEVTILNKRNSRNLPLDVKLKEQKVSWQDDTGLKDVCLGQDAIIHAAGMNANDCAKKPLDAFEFNGRVTGKLAKAAGIAGVPKFIYLSTYHVYGEDLNGKLTEQSQLQNPHPYAKSKILGEQQVLKFCKSTGIQPFIIRLSNCFGKPTAVTANCWHLLVPNLCAELAINRSLTLNNNPCVERNFLTISDLCHGIDFLLKNDIDTNILNFGGSKNFTLVEWIKFIEQRSYALFQIRPNIDLLNTAEKALEPSSLDGSKFQFDCSRAHRHGIKFNNDYTRELDDLLIFCFNNKSKLTRLVKQK